MGMGPYGDKTNEEVVAPKVEESEKGCCGGCGCEVPQPEESSKGTGE